MAKWAILDENGLPILTSDEATVAMAITVCIAVGDQSWNTADPRSGPRALAGWLSFAIARHDKTEMHEVAEKVFALPVDQLMSRLQVEV